jgi:glycerophosphoryl diester phosphodiesterase
VPVDANDVGMSITRSLVVAARQTLEGKWSAPVDPLLRQLALRATAFTATTRPSSSQVAMSACYDGGRPLLLGHRGAMARAPENTLGAFRAALDDGAHGVELDTTLSGDSVPVVLHDDTLDRTTSVIGKPVDFDADELAHVDAGSWFAGWGSEPVPRLHDALAMMPDGAVVNVELKGPTPAWIGLERRVVDVIRNHVPRINVIVSSFHPAQLLEVRRLDRSIPIAVLLWPKAVLPLRTAWAVPLLAPDAVHPPASIVDRAFVDAARTAGLRVHVWAVRSVDEGQRLLDLGVDGLIVDDVAAHAAQCGRTR